LPEPDNLLFSGLPIRNSGEYGGGSSEEKMKEKSKADDWQNYAEKKVWGHISGVVFGVEPLDGRKNSRWGYLPREQYVYYEMNDGAILRIYDIGYHAHLWPLIGTRQKLAIEGFVTALQKTPRSGFESIWTSQKDEIRKKTISPVPKTIVESDDIHPELFDRKGMCAYGRIERLLPGSRCLVDVGSGTISCGCPADYPLKIGDFVECAISDIMIYNLPPLKALSAIPGRLLHDVYYPLSKEHFIYFEVKNGEILYGFAPSFDLDPQKILGKVINFTCDHGFSPYTIERLKEPRQGIFSTYTKYTRDFLSQVYPIEEEEIKVFTVGTGSPGTPRKATKKDEDKDITIFEGILREVPYHEKMLLDTGIGTFLVNVVEDEFAPGDYVKCTVSGRFWISHIDYPVE
jgi:hypothetical protein